MHEGGQQRVTSLLAQGAPGAWVSTNGQPTTVRRCPVARRNILETEGDAKRSSVGSGDACTYLPSSHRWTQPGIITGPFQ